MTDGAQEATETASPPATAIATSSDLHATLSLFAELVMAERSVSETLQARGQAPAALAAVIAEDERLSAAERLDIYAHMYFYRIHDVLAEYLPRTARALGEDAFWNLLTGYLQRFPSRHPSLRYVGQDLATFAREDEPWSSTWPWLGDLVALEWARVDVFDRGDADVLTLLDVQACDPAALPTLSLRLIPAATVVHTSFAVEETWRTLGDKATDALPRTVEPGEASGAVEAVVAAPEAQARSLLVWRKDLAIHHRPLDEEERPLALYLQRGFSFGELCDRLAASRTAEAAAAAAVTLTVRWIGEGLLAKAEASSEASSEPSAARGLDR